MARRPLRIIFAVLAPELLSTSTRFQLQSRCANLEMYLGQKQSGYQAGHAFASAK